MSDQFVMDENGTHWQRPTNLTTWRGECGHLWDRSVEDTDECPRCRLESKMRYGDFYRATVTSEAERDLERLEAVRVRVANLIAAGILAQPDAGGLSYVQAQEIGTRVASKVVPW